MKPTLSLVLVVALAALAPSCTDPRCLAGDDDDDEGGGCLSGDFGTTPPAGVASDAACTSGAWWQGGDQESSQMHPGGDCISCHASEGEGPQFTIAGTVMGGLDDFEDCQGIGDVVVRITDADGVVTDLVSNAAGNFSFRGAIAFPYTATVLRGDVESPMATPQSEGNCMACHTAEGAGGAPGRIVAP